MNPVTVVALLLSLALVVFPSSPGRRLVPSARVTRRVVGARGAGCIAACVVIAAALLLPPTTVLTVAVVGAVASNGPWTIVERWNPPSTCWSAS
jgi:tight adherence protein B